MNKDFTSNIRNTVISLEDIVQGAMSDMSKKNIRGDVFIIFIDNYELMERDKYLGFHIIDKNFPVIVFKNKKLFYIFTDWYKYHVIEDINDERLKGFESVILGLPNYHGPYTIGYKVVTKYDDLWSLPFNTLTRTPYYKTLCVYCLDDIDHYIDKNITIKTVGDIDYLYFVTKIEEKQREIRIPICE